MSNVIVLPVMTKYNIDPERVLESAQGILSGVVLCGYDENGEIYFASSIADGAEVLWLLERSKKMLLEIYDTNLD